MGIRAAILCCRYPPLALGVLGVVFRSLHAQIVCNAHERTISTWWRQRTARAMRAWVFFFLLPCRSPAARRHRNATAWPALACCVSWPRGSTRPRPFQYLLLPKGWGSACQPARCQLESHQRLTLPHAPASSGPFRPPQRLSSADESGRPCHGELTERYRRGDVCRVFKRPCCKSFKPGHARNGAALRCAPTEY